MPTKSKSFSPNNDTSSRGRNKEPFGRVTIRLCVKYRAEMAWGSEGRLLQQT